MADDLHTAETQQLTTLPGAARWEIDPAHSDVSFSVKHMMISTVRGRFAVVSGHIDFDEANPTAALIDVAIDVASIDTRNEQRDEHLRSADFFDAAQYPTIAFRSTRVEQGRGDRFRIVGDLTMHGVTREVELDATYEGSNRDPWGGTRAGFTASTEIDRTAFGLTWNAALETGGVLVSEKVKITLDIQAVRQG